MDSYHSEQLDALGDATRRAILTRLANEGPLPVGKLARDFPMSRPAISQHLRILKRASLVTDHAAGTRRLYAVNPEALASPRADSIAFGLRPSSPSKNELKRKHGRKLDDTSSARVEETSSSE